MKKNKYPQNRKKHSSRKLWLLPVCFVVIVGIFAALQLTHTIHLFKKTIPTTQVVVKVGKPVAIATNNTSSNSPPATKTPSTGSSSVISGGTDTNGSASSSTSPSQWIVSDSGNITVKQPVANARLESGSVLSGSAKVSTVNFRLIDSSVGVISEGTLNVVNGNFSGALNFTSQSSSGRLDVFSTNAQGVELNEIQISVSF